MSWCRTGEGVFEIGPLVVVGKPFVVNSINFFVGARDEVGDCGGGGSRGRGSLSWYRTGVRYAVVIVGSSFGRYFGIVSGTIGREFGTLLHRCSSRHICCYCVTIVVYPNRKSSVNVFVERILYPSFTVFPDEQCFSISSRSLLLFFLIGINSHQRSGFFIPMTVQSSPVPIKK